MWCGSYMMCNLFLGSLLLVGPFLRDGVLGIFWERYDGKAGGGGRGGTVRVGLEIYQGASVHTCMQLGLFLFFFSFLGLGRKYICPHLSRHSFQSFVPRANPDPNRNNDNKNKKRNPHPKFPSSHYNIHLFTTPFSSLFLKKK